MQSLGELNEKFEGLFTETVIIGNEPSLTSDSGFGEQWGWESTLDNISNGRRDKWDYYFNMNVVELLNTLSYYKAKEDLIKMRLQKQKLRGK